MTNKEFLYLVTFLVVVLQIKATKSGFRDKRKIVGGVETGINEFPYMSAVVDMDLKRVYCNAVIVSDRYAMTVAHCLVSMNLWWKGLLVGDHDLSTGSETSTGFIHRIEKLIMHDYYNSKTQENDIALVKTVKQIVYNSGVGRVCLPYRYTYPTDNFNDTSVMALGWDTTDFTTANVLLSFNLTITPNSECQKKLQDNIITTQQICTYGGPNMDTCKLDSGSPLIWHDPSSNKDRVLGMVSYGKGCSSKKPSVNTWVSSYVNWIAGIVSEEKLCII